MNVKNKRKTKQKYEELRNENHLFHGRKLLLVIDKNDLSQNLMTI